MQSPTERFSDRVENYVKYRPSYPTEILDALANSCGLSSTSTIADIGSGTGILSKLFLDNGNIVYAVEPNQEMRTAAELLLKDYLNLKSVQGQAEQTTLGDRFIDIVAVGQAFHWFDQVKTKSEFIRILRPNGWVILVWNERKLDASPFLKGYEQLLETHAKEYKTVKHRNVSADDLSNFYKPVQFQRLTFVNGQAFDFEGLCGRVLSSSYVPNAGQPGHLEMLSDLQSLFNKHQVNGKVNIEYETLLYFGQLG
jgi:ubiquinone/menaquinone biosynthesis C-methylase UbiE